MTKWALTVCGDTNSNLAISRLVLPPPDSGPPATCIATSTDRTARASSTLTPWRSGARRTAAGILAGWYRVADQVMPESRPLPDSDACPLRQASRIVTSDSGTDNQLAAASFVTENRREALYRRRPIRPDRAIHTSRAPAALPGASRKPFIDECGPAGLGHDDAPSSVPWKHLTSRNGLP